MRNRDCSKDEQACTCNYTIVESLSRFYDLNNKIVNDNHLWTIQKTSKVVSKRILDQLFIPSSNMFKDVSVIYLKNE